MDMFDSKIKKNPGAYISYLQNQNRAKKLSEMQDKEKIINKQKEEAFNLYLQGANEERVDNQRKREKVSRLREKSVGINARKKWAEEVPKVVLKERKKEFSHPDAYSHTPKRAESLMNFKEIRSFERANDPKDQIRAYLSMFDEERLNLVNLYLENLINDIDLDQQ